MESLSPNIFVSDITATITFYESLGFSVINAVPESGAPVWAMMTSGKVTLMFQTFESLGNEFPSITRQPGGSLLFYISVTDIQELFDRISGQVTIVKGLEKTFYGATEFSIEDNNRYILTFAQHDPQ